MNDPRTATVTTNETYSDETRGKHCRARIVADSICSTLETRLVTFELTYPRIILAELDTHRAASRNTSSSRAVPLERQISRLLNDPYTPEFGKNQKGMSAEEALDEATREAATVIWERAKTQSVLRARDLANLGVHKQWINRLLEPFSKVATLFSMTEPALSHFFTLRTAENAQPEFQDLARTMYRTYVKSVPMRVSRGNAHLPMFDSLTDVPLLEDALKAPSQEWSDLLAAVAAAPYAKFGHGGPNPLETLSELRRVAVFVAVGRCCRVSYLTHDGKRDPIADARLALDLLHNGHWSPWEHVAFAGDAGDHNDGRSGNFGLGWTQARKCFDGEFVTKFVPGVWIDKDPR